MDNPQCPGLTGIFEFWHDEELILLGLHGSSFPELDQVRRGFALVDRWAFAAARTSPPRLSVTSLFSQDTDALLTCSWAGELSAVISGDPPVSWIAGERQEMGDLGLRAMLSPSWLSALIAAPWPESFEVDGPLVAADPAAFPAMLCGGADRYQATYDADTGVITSWAAEVQGRPARARKLTHLVQG